MKQTNHNSLFFYKSLVIKYYGKKRHSKVVVPVYNIGMMYDGIV